MEILEISWILFKNSPRVRLLEISISSKRGALNFRKIAKQKLFGKNEFSPALGFCYPFQGLQGGGEGVSAVLPGRWKRDPGTRVDLIGSRERGRINKIYLAWNTGILYRVDKSHGHPVDKAPPFIAPTR